MTTFLSNRDIYESVICGIVPQVRDFKFCTIGVNVLAADEVSRRQDDGGTEIAKEKHWNPKGEKEMNVEETNVKNTDEHLEELFRGCGLSPLQVATAVVDVTLVPLDEICNCNKSSDPKVTDARGLAMYLAMKCTTKSLVEIARFFKCTHVLIYYKAQEISKRLLTDDFLSGQIDPIVARLQDMCK